MAIDTKSMMKADKKLAQGAIKSAKALLSDLSKTQKAIDRAMIAENKRDKRIAQDTVKSAKAYLKNLNSGFDNAGALLTIKIEGNCSKFHSTDVPHVIAESEESELPFIRSSTHISSHSPSVSSIGARPRPPCRSTACGSS